MYAYETHKPLSTSPEQGTDIDAGLNIFTLPPGKWNKCSGCAHELLLHEDGICIVYPCMCNRNKEKPAPRPKALEDLDQLEC